MVMISSSLDPTTSKEIVEQLLSKFGNEQTARALDTDQKFIEDVLNGGRCLSSKHIKSFERHFDRSLFDWFASSKLPSVPEEHRQMTEEAIQLFKTGFDLEKEILPKAGE